MPKLEQLAARKAAIKEQYQHDATITAQAARITQLEARLAEWEKLQDPAALHQNLLRGLPARLEPKDFLHLAGEKYQAMAARIAELEKDSARYRKVRDELIAVDDKPAPVESAVLELLRRVVSERGPEAFPTSSEFDTAIDQTLSTESACGDDEQNQQTGHHRGSLTH